MEPTWKKGEMVEVNASAYRWAEPKRWDVVVFDPPAEAVPGVGGAKGMGAWAFRVVGLPGDTVEFDGPQMLINGKPAQVPARMSGVSYKATTASGRPDGPNAPKYPYVVPDDKYFVLGDNADHANDSRLWGGLSRVRILGKVLGK